MGDEYVSVCTVLGLKVCDEISEKYGFHKASPRGDFAFPRRWIVFGKREKPIKTTPVVLESTDGK